MKKLIIMSALVMGGLGINNASAQFGIRINLHLGTRPVYVPAPQPVEVEEQPVYDDYYYMPELEAYYSVGEHCYYYQDGDAWVSAAYLPGYYRDFDWRTVKHYEVRTARPYMHNDVYRARYGGFANRDQFYARAYPERGRYDNRYAYRGHQSFDNRGFDRRDDRGGFDRRDDNRGGFNRRDDRNQNAYNQPNRNNGGYNQPAQPAQPQGGYYQPNRNNGGYNQPAQPQSGNTSQWQGGNNGNSQPAQNQGQQGGYNRGQGQNQGQQGGSNAQPANHTGGQNGGSYAGGQFAANKMGVVQDRGQFARPVRNN